MKFRILLLAYLSSLLMSSGLGWIFYSGFLDISGNTLGLESLRSEFEFLSLSEAVRVFSDFIGDFSIMALLYLFFLYFFQLFLSAGLLDAVVNGKLSFTRFIIQGLRRLGGFWALHLLLSTIGLLLLLLSYVVGKTIHANLALPDHRNVILSYAAPLIICSLGLLLLYAIWDLTRIYMVKGKPLFKALKAARTCLRKQAAPWRYFSFFLLLMLLAALMYRLLSPYLFPVLILAQQVYLFLRISIRWVYLQYLATVKPDRQ
jgi:hypothetical protein